ncbi:serine/threonine-protein kinase [Streptomyces sp. MAR25Y5]|uniref:serine/threonine-protein kinase n=1 Tax=Streptomyces sp. MAR25Y5 TaxID=2962028 RepID=UPI0020B734DA|nr:serine/threonine-protein kinase [Streptomyces sp. MAR25Y5]MCP3768225.1 serine/threonine protein kinase [Streptomyces sp. MAR25Y5]
MTHDTGLFAGRPSGPTGQRVAGYRIEREIGRGGTAVVYRARDLRLDRTVALKLLAPELARNDVFRRRFTHESRIAAALDHPHIVPVFEAGEEDGILYIAMRYVEGSDLRRLLDREGPLPFRTALRIAVQVASALDAAHEHGLVHRDVKPGNILVARGTDSDHPEHVYLTDFGLTKKSLSLTGFTTVGQFVGTLDYVAPEQISGRPVDARCDVYGLACVVHETLAGHPPFRRDDDMALLWAHQYDEPPPLTAIRPDLAPRTDAVLAKALAKSPDDRYASCLDLVAALRTAVTGDGTTTAPEGRHPATRVDLGGSRNGSTGGDGSGNAVEGRSGAAPAGGRTERDAPRPPPAWARPAFGPARTW